MHSSSNVNIIITSSTCTIPAALGTNRVLQLQLGAAWFDTLAEELFSGAYGPYAADAYFQQQDTLRSSSNSNAAASLAARAVLVDMEPKVLGCRVI